MGSYAGQRRQTSCVSGWIKFALLGVIFSVLFQGAFCDEATEVQCRPYIEKALKEHHLEEKVLEEADKAELFEGQEESPPTDELTDSTEGLTTNEDERKEDDDADEADVKKEDEDDDGGNEDDKTEEDNVAEEEDVTNEGQDTDDNEEKEEGEDDGENAVEEDAKEESPAEDQAIEDDGEGDADGKTNEEDEEKTTAASDDEVEDEQEDDADLDKPIDVEIREVEMDTDDDEETAAEEGEDEDEKEEKEDTKEAEEEETEDEVKEEEEKEKGDDEDGVKEDEEKEKDEGEDATASVDEDAGEAEKEEEPEKEDETEEVDELPTEKDEKEDNEKEDKTDGEDESKDKKDDDEDEVEEKIEKSTVEEVEAEGEGEEEEAEGKEEGEEGKEEVEEGKEEGEEGKEEGEEGKEEGEEGKEEEEGKEGEEGKEEGEEEKEEKEAAESEAQEGDKEAPEEEELIQEMVIPDNLRPRDHIDKILRLEDSGLETVLEKTIDSTLKGLKSLYDNAIKPLEMLYKYRDLSNRHFGDPEIFSKPLVLFMGPWSGGKSSTINYLLDNEFSHTSLRTGAEPSPAYFNILMHGQEEEILDGTQLAADWTFSGLQKFGQTLLDRLKGVKLPNKLLEKVNIVEIPGILEIRKQVQRLFPFNDACQWFIDRADIIFLVYDPSKLDVGPETEAILDQLKGREYQTRIILNKADQVKPEELMRVQGTLIWNISPLMSSTEPPIMYSTSLWSLPYEIGAPIRLLQAQERAFLRDLREAIDKRVENKIASARRFAVRVRNHAKMVDCYLTTYYNHKTIFGNRKKISDDIIEYPQKYHIYEGLSTLTNISRYDLPDPDVYRDFFKINPLYEFKKLSETCTYFRGCPINQLDVAIAYDLPELVGKYRKSVETAKEQLQKENS